MSVIRIVWLTIFTYFLFREDNNFYFCALVFTHTPLTHSNTAFCVFFWNFRRCTRISTFRVRLSVMLSLFEPFGSHIYIIYFTISKYKKQVSEYKFNFLTLLPFSLHLLRSLFSSLCCILFKLLKFIFYVPFFLQCLKCFLLSDWPSLILLLSSVFLLLLSLAELLLNLRNYD